MILVLADTPSFDPHEATVFTTYFLCSKYQNYRQTIERTAHMPRGISGLPLPTAWMELQYIDGAGVGSVYAFIFLGCGLFEFHDYHDDGF